MKTIRVIQDDFDQTLWNTLAMHPLQSWEWGEVRKAEGKQIVRLAEYGKNELTAVYLMTLHPIPFFSAFTIGYIPKSHTPSVEVIDFLKEYIKKHNVLFIKWEPHIKKKENNFEKKGLDIVESTHPLFTRWNQVLDITCSEEDLVKNMHHKTRYNVRLAKKKGVVVENMSTDSGYKIFEQLYFETCKRQRYHGHTKVYHQNIWSHLSLPCQDISPRSYIFISSYQGDVLGAFQLWRFKDAMYYVYGGSSEKHKNVMAPNLLMWEAIRFAKQIGCKTFDMWGSLPPKFDLKNPWAGFTRFKEGYGTAFIEYMGSYDLIGSRIGYSLYSAAHLLRSKILQSS